MFQVQVLRFPMQEALCPVSARDHRFAVLTTVSPFAMQIIHFPCEWPLAGALRRYLVSSLPSVVDACLIQEDVVIDEYSSELKCLTI